MIVPFTVVERGVMVRLSALQQNVRVSADGKVTRGMRVPHRAANIKDTNGPRVVAAPPASHRHRRFAPGGVPKGVRLDITTPHDCENHLADVAIVAAFTDYAEEVS